jgi:hypothetical protein
MATRYSRALFSRATGQNRAREPSETKTKIRGLRNPNSRPMGKKFTPGSIPAPHAEPRRQVRAVSLVSALARQRHDHQHAEAVSANVIAYLIDIIMLLPQPKRSIPTHIHTRPRQDQLHQSSR